MAALGGAVLAILILWLAIKAKANRYQVFISNGHNPVLSSITSWAAGVLVYFGLCAVLLLPYIYIVSDDQSASPDQAQTITDPTLSFYDWYSTRNGEYQGFEAILGWLDSKAMAGNSVELLDISQWQTYKQSNVEALPAPSKKQRYKITITAPNAVTKIQQAHTVLHAALFYAREYKAHEMLINLVNHPEALPIAQADYYKQATSAYGTVMPYVLQIKAADNRQGQGFGVYLER